MSEWNVESAKGGAIKLSIRVTHFRKRFQVSYSILGWGIETWKDTSLYQSEALWPKRPFVHLWQTHAPQYIVKWEERLHPLQPRTLLGRFCPSHCLNWIQPVFWEQCLICQAVKWGPFYTPGSSRFESKAASSPCRIQATAPSPSRYFSITWSRAAFPASVFIWLPSHPLSFTDSFVTR